MNNYNNKKEWKTKGFFEYVINWAVANDPIPNPKVGFQAIDEASKLDFMECLFTVIPWRPEPEDFGRLKQNQKRNKNKNKNGEITGQTSSWQQSVEHLASRRTPRNRQT